MDERERRAAIPWFAGLDAHVRALLIGRGRWRRRAAGEWVYGEGDEDTGLVAVVDGALYLHAQAAGGREVLFAMAPAGTVIGQSGRFGGGPRLITATCAAECLLFSLSDHALQQTAATHPTLWMSVSTLLYGQLRLLVESMAEFVALKPRQRMIARLLAFEASANPVPISQAALAEIVGVSRNAVNGWLAELEADGVIERRYGRIAVLRRDDLRRRLETGTSG